MFFFKKKLCQKNILRSYFHFFSFFSLQPGYCSYLAGRAAVNSKHKPRIITHALTYPAVADRTVAGSSRLGSARGNADLPAPCCALKTSLKRARLGTNTSRARTGGVAPRKLDRALPCARRMRRVAAATTTTPRMAAEEMRRASATTAVAATAEAAAAEAPAGSRWARLWPPALRWIPTSTDRIIAAEKRLLSVVKYGLPPHFVPLQFRTGSVLAPSFF
jgi:hypothetical protein